MEWMLHWKCHFWEIIIRFYSLKHSLKSKPAMFLDARSATSTQNTLVSLFLFCLFFTLFLKIYFSFPLVQFFSCHRTQLILIIFAKHLTNYFSTVQIELLYFLLATKNEAQPSSSRTFISLKQNVFPSVRYSTSSNILSTDRHWEEFPSELLMLLSQIGEFSRSGTCLTTCFVDENSNDIGG